MGCVPLLNFDGTVTPTNVGHLVLSPFMTDRWIPLDEAWNRGKLRMAQYGERPIDYLKRRFGRGYTYFSHREDQ